MYAKCKAWLKAYGIKLLIIVLLLFGTACMLSGGENVPSNRNRAEGARVELESAADDNSAVEERIRAAEESADRIEKSAVRSGELADKAENLLADCQRIITGESIAEEKKAKDHLKRERTIWKRSFLSYCQ